MDTPGKLPFYAKASLLSIGLYAAISMLYIAQYVILPVIYAVIIAVALGPVVNFFVKKKIARSISIAIVLLIALVIAGGLITLLSFQASRFSQALPQLTDTFQMLINQTVTWASGYFNISPQKINDWITSERKEFIGHSNAAIGTTLSIMGFVVAAAVLTIVYVCMILFYKSHLIESIHKLFGVRHDNNVREILTEIKTIIQSYLSGLFVEFAIVSTLNILGFLVLGINYAILLGIIGGLLNVIPYIGGIVAVALFMVIALVTKSPVYMLYVIALHLFIQFVDNNYIVPKIVGSKVKLNALICIIAVIAGDALWGVPGMFLSIPLTGIIKLILDRIEPLKPWGFLLGSTTPAGGKMKFHFTIKGLIAILTSKKILSKK